MTLNTTELSQQINPYNSEPVFYCKHCLSLKVIVFNENEDYCDDCGNTDIASASVEEWDKLYEEKYGSKFLKQKKNGCK